MASQTNKAGFTLVEVLIATLLVGLAITALLTANSAFTIANGTGADLSTAEFLAEQIRELTTLLPVIDPDTGTATFGAEAGETLSTYDDLDDFDGKTYHPPINANRLVLNDFAAFSQQVTVQNISPTNFEQVVAHPGSNFVRVTVKILLNLKEVTSASWIRARY